MDPPSSLPFHLPQSHAPVIVHCMHSAPEQADLRAEPEAIENHAYILYTFLNGPVGRRLDERRFNDDGDAAAARIVSGCGPPTQFGVGRQTVVVLVCVCVRVCVRVCVSWGRSIAATMQLL